MSHAKPSAVWVIIVTYRSAALTVACLRSLLPERNLPGMTIRAVVVDNASGDAPDIAAAIEAEGWSTWVTLIVAPRNGGFAYGNNLGFARAFEDGSPDYLHLLNPDTQIKPGAIHSLVKFLKDHPEAGIAGSSFENHDGSDWPFAFRFPSLLSELEGGAELGSGDATAEALDGGPNHEPPCSADRLGGWGFHDDPA